MKKNNIKKYIYLELNLVEKILQNKYEKKKMWLKKRKNKKLFQHSYWVVIK